MANTFSLEIITPRKKLISQEVSEVVLPAHDGERGILANHGDFIGLLGTGPLKIISSGDDYWCMISSGVYEVKGGKLSIIAQVGEKAEEIASSLKELEARKSELEAFLANISLDDELEKRAELEKLRARFEVYRRTALLN